MANVTLAGYVGVKRYNGDVCQNFLDDLRKVASLLGGISTKNGGHGGPIRTVLTDRKPNPDVSAAIWKFQHVQKARLGARMKYVDGYIKPAGETIALLNALNTKLVPPELPRNGPLPSPEPPKPSPKPSPPSDEPTIVHRFYFRYMIFGHLGEGHGGARAEGRQQESLGRRQYLSLGTFAAKRPEGSSTGPPSTWVGSVEFSAPPITDVLGAELEVAGFREEGRGTVTLRLRAKPGNKPHKYTDWTATFQPVRTDRSDDDTPDVSSFQLKIYMDPMSRDPEQDKPW